MLLIACLIIRVAQERGKRGVELDIPSKAFCAGGVGASNKT